MHACMHLYPCSLLRFANACSSLAAISVDSGPAAGDVDSGVAGARWWWS